jgi:3-oxoacyl-[acyl-carrier-protein] synthase II
VNLPNTCNPCQTTPRRVVVTGYGVVSALGNDMDTLWKSIMSYQVGYRKVEFSDPKIVSKFFGVIDNKPSLEKYPKALLKFVPEFGRYGLVAADQAITMAFGSDQVFRDSYDPFDRGVVFGTGWGALDQSGFEYSSYARTKWASPFANLIVMPNVATAAISIAWGLKGYQNTPIAACATGSLAIGDAYEVIRSGRAKVMLAGGGESIREEFSVWTVDVLRALSKEQESAALACCPFSRARSGFVMSEGAAVLCLEDLEYAQARGANILGEIAGFATYSDAADMTASGADISARTKTIKDALARAGIDGSHLGYINAHGTSTPLNDISETRALKEALGDWAYKIPTSSTKSYTGHLIAATGSLESALCLRTMETGIAPATIHLTDPDPECDLDYVANVHRQIAPPQYALNVNYGFGGINTALVFRRYE